MSGSPLYSVSRLAVLGLFRALGMALICLILGCNKPNPNPELLDPIYADLEKQIKEAEGQVSSQEKIVDGFKDAMDEVKPQTGQIKYARKRLYDAEIVLNRSKQHLEYLKLHLNTRRKEDQVNYLKAYNAEKPWPDPSEYAEYREHEKLQEIDLKWDVKARIEATKIPEKKAHSSEAEHE